MSGLKRAWIGPGLIAAAAFLWATDALFRVRAVHALDPLVLVLLEHLLGTLVLLIPILLLHRADLTKLGGRGWFCAIVAGVGGSAFGTLFFTASFRYINPSVAILIQKIQPVLVVLLATVFLKERPPRSFYGWALLALGAVTVLSFPDLDFRFLKNGLDLHSRGVLFAAAAAALWALSTVAGKVFTQTVEPIIVTFWRYAFGLSALAALVWFARTPIPFAVLREPSIQRSVGYMGLVSGLLAMIFYYSGLKRTPATVATFVELIFPVSAVILNAYFLDSPLSLGQALSGGILLFAVTQITRT